MASQEPEHSTRRAQVFTKWRQHRAAQKVRPGAGHALKPWRWWHLFWRSLFFLHLTGEHGERQTYAVSGNYFSEESQTDVVQRLWETAHSSSNGTHHDSLSSSC